MENGEGAFLYIVRCADGSLYTGITRTGLELRVAQHNTGTLGGYTATRRPVTLVFSQWFNRITDAIENERKLKRQTRAKKEAFIRGDFDALRLLAARRSSHSSRPMVEEQQGLREAAEGVTPDPHGEERKARLEP